MLVLSFLLTAPGNSNFVVISCFFVSEVQLDENMLLLRFRLCLNTFKILFSLFESLNILNQWHIFKPQHIQRYFCNQKNLFLCILDTTHSAKAY